MNSYPRRNACEMEDIACPVCRRNDYDVYYSNTKDLLHGFPGRFRYVRCKDCRHLYMNPRPELNSIIRFYPEDYDPHRRARPNHSGNSVSRWLSPVKRIEEFLKARIGEDSSVLDIGCGRGDFLESIRTRTNCRCSGIDFNPQAAEAAAELYGIKVYCGTAVSANLVNNSYDAVVMIWYLEHDPFPLETFLLCRNILKKDGWLIFCVPNYKSLNAGLFGSKWFHLDAPRHLSIYCTHSIRHLSTSTGFSIRKIEWDRSTWGLTGSLQNSFSGFLKSKISGHPLIRAVSLPCTLAASFLKISDNITIYAQKNHTFGFHKNG